MCNSLVVSFHVEADCVFSVQVDVSLNIFWGVGQVKHLLPRVESILYITLTNTLLVKNLPCSLYHLRLLPHFARSRRGREAPVLERTCHPGEWESQKQREQQG